MGRISIFAPDAMSQHKQRTFGCHRIEHVVMLSRYAQDLDKIPINYLAAKHLFADRNRRAVGPNIEVRIC
jgi:hypothetical protein